MPTLSASKPSCLLINTMPPAAEEYAQAARLDPEHAHLHVGLGRVMAKLGGHHLPLAAQYITRGIVQLGMCMLAAMCVPWVLVLVLVCMCVCVFCFVSVYVCAVHVSRHFCLYVAWIMQYNNLTQLSHGPASSTQLLNKYWGRTTVVLGQSHVWMYCINIGKSRNKCVCIPICEGRYTCVPCMCTNATCTLRRKPRRGASGEATSSFQEHLIPWI